MILDGPLAQLVEQLTLNQLVVGSIPTRPTISASMVKNLPGTGRIPLLGIFATLIGRLAIGLGPRHRRLKSEVLHERIKILVAVKQCQSSLNTACRDQCVDGFSHSDSKQSQCSEVVGGLDGNISPDKVYYWQ